MRGELPLQIFPSKNGSGLGSIAKNHRPGFGTRCFPMYHVQLQKHRQHHDFSESSSSPVPEPPEWIRPPGLSHWSTNSRETACPSALRHPKLQAKKEASMKFHLEMPEPHAAIDAPMLAFCPATASVGRAPQIVSVPTYNETSHL